MKAPKPDSPSSTRRKTATTLHQIALTHGLAALLGALTLATALCVPRDAHAVTLNVTRTYSPYPGITIKEIRTSAPATHVRVAFIDLCSDYVHVDATAPTTSLRTASSWGSAQGAQLAVNGDFYRTGPLRVYGQAVGGGTVWPAINTGVHANYEAEWYYKDYGWIAFGPNQVEFGHTRWAKRNRDVKYGWEPDVVEHTRPPNTLALVSGFPELVTEGQQFTCTSPTASTCFPDRGDMRERHPRMAMGLTEDRRTFILAVVDGRTSASAGMYGAELAELMFKLGAWQAFNLDGGGSAQMWLEGSGYLNNATGNNGGGSVRAVANHWGVFAGASNGKDQTPGHCVDILTEAVLQPGVLGDTTTDFDGSDTADLCIRAPDGLTCAPMAGDGAGPVLETSLLQSGWTDEENFATIRFGDLNGDGRADLCARSNSGVTCRISEEGAPFSRPIPGPAWSDDAGWTHPSYYATIRLADVTGDGQDDLCARAAEGLRCYASTGEGFVDLGQTSRFPDNGFRNPSRYGTLRYGDLNADGRADVCARRADGVVCWLSDGMGGFPTRFDGPEWSDALGWGKVAHWSTIRLVDVNNDGRADLCARSADGLRCHFSNGTEFGPAVRYGILSNDSGWSDPSNYATLRFADIDGDGDQDLCARADAGWSCWPYDNGDFGPRFDGPALSDAQGWNIPHRYTTIRMADVTGDGRADLCAHGDDRVRCWPSLGDRFGAPINGPSWVQPRSSHMSTWGAFHVAGVAVEQTCEPFEEVCNGIDDDCDGQVDQGDVCDTPDAGTPDDTGPDPIPDASDDAIDDTDTAPDAQTQDSDLSDVASDDDSASPDDPDDDPSDDSDAQDDTSNDDAASSNAATTQKYAEGCACRVQAPTPQRKAPLLLATLALLGLTLARRRREARTS